MCICVLILPSRLNPHLIIAGNRDEAFERPTATLSRLENGVYCGVDLVRGGTWLGVKPASSSEENDSFPARFAYLTNFTESYSKLKHGSPSRGQLPMDWLSSDLSAEEFLSSKDFSNYNGFNLVIGLYHPNQYAEVYATTNRGEVPNDNRFELCPWGAVGATFTARFRSEDDSLEPFTVALCNGTLGAHWEKVDRCEEGARSLNDFSDEALLALMQDETPCSQLSRDENNKNKEMNEVDEDEFSPIFILPETYRGRIFGTRTTSVMRILPDGTVHCNEKNYINQECSTCISSLPPREPLFEITSSI